MNKMIEAMATKMNGAEEVEYHMDGNFTCCVIRKGKKKYVGFAKRDPNLDEYNAMRGEEIAFKRALKKLAQEKLGK